MIPIQVFSLARKRP